MAFEQFSAQFGAPRAGTGRELTKLGLSNSGTLMQLETEVGCGVFADGLISIASVREQVDDLGGWQDWLPQGARLFASSVFGILYVTSGADVWVVNTQYGEIIEAELNQTDAIVDMAAAETRQEVFQEELFQRWRSLGHTLPEDAILCPVPAIALGGNWSVQTITPMSLAVYLSFTAKLFGPAAGINVNVIRRNQ